MTSARGGRVWVLFGCGAVSFAGCTTGAPPVTTTEACRNVSRVCRDLFTEQACLSDAADAGIDEPLLLCLANADTCDELLACQGGLTPPRPDAG